jgi:1-acyl-sn-glycerol-3-phosphate acyltransferase
MEDLHVRTRSDAEPSDALEPARAPAVPRILRAARSLAFIAIYFFGYLMLYLGLGQRLVVWPLVTLVPSIRRRVVGGWLRLHAFGTLAVARTLGGLRLSVRGRIPAEPVVVLMNHQSVLDIPLGISMIPGPYPIIPTRARYRHGLPGISPLVRLARYPVLSQRRPIPADEVAALERLGDEVAAGLQSALIFPEGHRSRTGEIGRFMTTGLKLVLARAPRPVYCIVADGMWRSRTFADAAFRFAGTRIDAVVLGPFTPPADPSRFDAFIGELRDRMVAALDELRRPEARRSEDRPDLS